MGFNWEELDRYEDEIDRRNHRQREGFTYGHILRLFLKVIYCGLPLYYLVKIVCHKTGFEIVRSTSFLDGLSVGTVIGLVSYFRQYTLEKKNGRLALRENLLDDSNEVYDDPLDYERKYRARAEQPSWQNSAEN